MNHLRRVAGVVQQAGCPFSSQRHLHSRRATKEAVQNAEVARLFEETTRELMRRWIAQRAFYENVKKRGHNEDNEDTKTQSF